MLRLLHGTAHNQSRPRLVAAAVLGARRFRFYKPIYGHGQSEWDRNLRHQNWYTQAWWLYEPRPSHPKPLRPKPFNNYFGPKRLWNPIPQPSEIVARKHADFGWPHRKPPPTGLRNSWEYFPYWFDKYFPDVTARLVIDSVLNCETMEPRFHFPAHVSRAEVANYLQNIHGFENIDNVDTRNYSGLRYKNEIGAIKMFENYKEATVRLDSPVMVELKTVRETRDVGDGKTKEATDGS